MVRRKSLIGLEPDTFGVSRGGKTWGEGEKF